MNECQEGTGPGRKRRRWCAGQIGVALREKKTGDDSRGGVRSRLTSERNGSDRRKRRRKRRRGCVEEAAERKWGGVSGGVKMSEEDAG